MPNDPESRLRSLFAPLPTASKAVEDRALAAALGALPAPGSRQSRPLRTMLLVAAAAVCLLAVSAAALGAAGALHVRLGAAAKPTLSPAVSESRLIVPRGAHGIAAVIDGRLWFTSRSGLRIEGLPVESAALEPHALYVATGLGDSLVVMADLCLDEYTDHGHCGLLTAGGDVDNDATLERYASIALAQAAAGVQVVGPSGMMDGQVGAIRSALDGGGFSDVAIMAYSAKYASAFYGPFREAAECAPQ